MYKRNCTFASGVKDCGLLFFFLFPTFCSLAFLDQLDKRMDGRLLPPHFLPGSSVERSRIIVQLKKIRVYSTLLISL